MSRDERMAMPITDEELVREARSVLSPRRIHGFMVADVGCALVTDRGNVYLGTNIDTSSGSVWAEHCAISAMVTHGEYGIGKIVAVLAEEKSLPLQAMSGSSSIRFTRRTSIRK